MKKISAEFQRVTVRATELHGKLKKLADDDQGQTAVGVILFWPALFFLEGGDGVEAQEYAHLKGARDALHQTSVKKDCGVEIKPIVGGWPATPGRAIQPPYHVRSTSDRPASKFNTEQLAANQATPIKPHRVSQLIIGYRATSRSSVARTHQSERLRAIMAAASSAWSWLLNRP